MDPAGVPSSSSDLYTSQGQQGYNSSAIATAAAALSQQHAAPPNGSETNPRKRKASGVPGSRGVANLTPEQLAKKRANDREAQRAIRERTKHTIEGLEQQIRELESQQPYVELQRVAQERDLALAECEQLRNKLAMVQSVIGGTSTPQPQPQQQPNLHGTFDLFDEFIDPTWLTEGQTELAAVTAQQSRLPPLHSPTASPYAQGGAGQPYDRQHVHPDLRSPRSERRPSLNHSVATSGPSYPSQSPSIHQSPADHDNLTNTQYTTPDESRSEPRLPAPSVAVDQSNGYRLGLDYVLEPKPHLAANLTPPDSSPQYMPSPTTGHPLYATVPRFGPPTCPLDRILLDFISKGRERIANGEPLDDVIGPDYPTFDGLREPGASENVISHPISALLTEILFKFPGISGLAERVAVHYLMFLSLRWTVCPCETCFERLPEWYRPMKEQLEIPHAAWLEHIPHPYIRRTIINGPDVSLVDFFIPWTSTLSVNWPYPDDHVLVPATEHSERWPSAFKMNPAFESHMRELGSWSIGPIFQTTFPQLVGEGVRIRY